MAVASLSSSTTTPSPAGAARPSQDRGWGGGAATTARCFRLLLIAVWTFFIVIRYVCFLFRIGSKGRHPPLLSLSSPFSLG